MTTPRPSRKEPRPKPGGGADVRVPRPGHPGSGTRSADTSPAPPRGGAARTAVLALIPIALTFALRVRLLGVPLERDEGGYAYAAWRMLQGVPPFVSSFDIKMPFLYVLDAGVMSLFGGSIAGIHAGLAAFSAASAVLVFLLARELLDEWAGLAAGCCFALVSASRFVEGFSANAEALLLPFALGALLVYRKALRSGARRDFFASGLLAGLALIVKHHGLFFVAILGIHLLLRSFLGRARPRARWALPRIALLFSAMLAPLAAQTAVFAALGLIRPYTYWLFRYPAAHAERAPLELGLSLLGQRFDAMSGSFAGILLLAAVGLATCLLEPRPRERRSFVLLFVMLSFLAVSPDLLFMPHYFVLALPALAVCAGLGVAAIAGPQDVTPAASSRRRSRAPRWIAGALALAAAGALLANEHAYFFQQSPDEISRTCFGGNPFPESVPIANYLRDHTGPRDRIAILGSEPQILYYARRASVSPHLFMYPLVRNSPDASAMQEELIRSVETDRPRYLVHVNVDPSWQLAAGAPTRILQWDSDYEAQHYRLVGVADILADRTEYRWGAELAGYRPQSRFWVGVLERN